MDGQTDGRIDGQMMDGRADPTDLTDLTDRQRLDCQIQFKLKSKSDRTQLELMSQSCRILVELQSKSCRTHGAKPDNYGRKDGWKGGRTDGPSAGRTVAAHG